MTTFLIFSNIFFLFFTIFTILFIFNLKNNLIKIFGKNDNILKILGNNDLDINIINNELLNEIENLKLQILNINNKNILLENNLILKENKNINNSNNFNNIIWGVYDIILSISEKQEIQLNEENSLLLNSLGKLILYIDKKDKKEINDDIFEEVVNKMNLTNIVHIYVIDEIIQLIKFIIITNDLEYSLELLEEYKINKILN
jgi:hypothetical protein